ncbi:MAG: response regulator [Acidobacteria bacterium]|nr:response regulator [Acidobacteriota bacterium]
MTQTILLADDSVTIRKVVELTFMDESFDLVTVGSGAEALERFDPSIDLVIADVHMPGADGYQVCAEVKKRSSKTPVLLLVGTFETFDEKKASDAGADGHLKKPFDSQDLLGRVHELLARSEGAGANSEPAPESTLGPAPGADGSKPADVTDSMAAASVGARESPAQPEPSGAAPVVSGDAGSDLELSEESIDRIARRVVELLSEDTLREVAWEVIPDLAEVVIKERLNELESQVE